jgi:hypothetical protein
MVLVLYRPLNAVGGKLGRDQRPRVPASRAVISLVTSKRNRLAAVSRLLCDWFMCHWR